MLRKTNVELENLTPELAQKFATMDKLPGERPLKQKRLKFFEDHLKAGTFIDPRWSVGICKKDGKKYRLDGQHTSTILTTIAHDTPEIFPKDKLVTIDTYEFDSIEEDAAMLFDTFDNPASTRSNEDMMGVFKSEHDDLSGIGSGFCVEATAGIYFYESHQKNGKKYPPRVRGLYLVEEQYRDFVNWLKQLFDEEGVKNGWLMNKSGIIGEMLSDWKTDAATAKEFWSYVLKENHPDVDHTTRELIEDLKKWRIKQEHKKQEDYGKIAAKSWKRYRKEVEIDKAA